MDNTREKLIELLKKTPIAEINGHIAEAEVCFVSHVFESMSNHLIANGVTVQKWIPVTERLPETTCRNLVTKYGIPFLAYYTGKEWRESGTLSVVDGITHWMPLPEPPKE